LASIPMGPVMILVMQKTLCHGKKSGFMSGLGSVFTDTFYACIALFAVSMVQDFITRWESWIFLVGGLIVVYVGLNVFFNDPVKKLQAADKDEHNIRYACEVALCAIANPGALALMLALVAMSGITDSNVPGGVLLLFISLGCAVFWFAFTSFVNVWRKAITGNRLRWVNRLTGVGVFILGVVLTFKGIVAIL